MRLTSAAKHVCRISEFQFELFGIINLLLVVLLPGGLAVRFCQHYARRTGRLRTNLHHVRRCDCLVHLCGEGNGRWRSKIS